MLENSNREKVRRKAWLFLFLTVVNLAKQRIKSDNCQFFMLSAPIIVLFLLNTDKFLLTRCYTAAKTLTIVQKTGIIKA